MENENIFDGLDSQEYSQGSIYRRMILLIWPSYREHSYSVYIVVVALRFATPHFEYPHR